MNLDDLIAVWRSQDAAPLHGVDRTLLHLALRQDDARLQRQRSRERWIIYVFSVGVVLAMGVFIAMMIGARDRNGITGWDIAVAIAGAAGALVAGGAMYVARRRQVRCEQRFGESLRDQINRSIAQLDDQATKARQTSVLVTVLMGGVCPTAILLLGYRINGMSISDGDMLAWVILTCGYCVGAGVWSLRRQIRNVVLPRKRQLEGLLNQLDGVEES
jgi:hypothetical protein